MSLQPEILHEVTPGQIRLYITRLKEILPTTQEPELTLLKHRLANARLLLLRLQGDLPAQGTNLLFQPFVLFFQFLFLVL